MKSSTLLEIEEKLTALSPDEKLVLFGQLARQLQPTGVDSDFEAQLAAMAADPDIQREIKSINHEFSGTEMDGLENL